MSGQAKLVHNWYRRRLTINSGQYDFAYDWVSCDGHRSDSNRPRETQDPVTCFRCLTTWAPEHRRLSYYVGAIRSTE